MRPTTAILVPLALAAALPAMGQGDPSAWRNSAPEQPAVLVVRNATIWTSGPAGRLEEADLLIRRGRVAAVGTDLEAPPEALEIDAHSHTAVQGGVNEGTNIVTAEVRIADVIQPESIDIYRQLAGGLTAANLLHGSANAIGGQSAVIKLRWGAPPSELLLAGAKPGIKLALGENPKQSNWNVDERRYPQTRMGVEQVIRERFRQALDYRRRWREFEAGSGRDRVPPRRDLQLEALVEILEGRRDIHAHSYRADEILMLMQVAEELGFRIRCFQHVLEGYKVADELAAHGATASTFSDWWAYKYEVIDAIPYNGSIMADRGVVVSFNSDSSELARRLNLEAAKAVRYGGVPEEEALGFVTLNPAIQLGAEERIGSLEPGKDGDFVIWSGHPLSTYSIVEQTWIEGRRYFDRAEDLSRRRATAAERDMLLKKARAKEELDEAPDASVPPDEELEPGEEPVTTQEEAEPEDPPAAAEEPRTGEDAPATREPPAPPRGAGGEGP
jgi:imidazolonepropionase-like amidohydrolase